MGVVGDGTVVAPFANEAMRLLREDWKGKYGAKMLAEELFPILQTGIPNPDQNFQNFITINAGEDGAFAALIDKFGNQLFKIDEFNGFQAIEPPGYPPPKLKPRIVWDAKTIDAGDSLASGQLDAVAVDPETGAEVPGVYVYTPPSGTTYPSAGTVTLYVNFTPTDGVKYRRSMGSTVLTVAGTAPSVSRVAQSQAANFGGGGPTITFASDVVSGNTIFVIVQSENQPVGITHTVTDSQGGSYSQVGSYVGAVGSGGDEMEVSVWQATVVSSGPNVVSITYSNGATGYKVAYEVRDVASVEDIAIGSGSSASPGASFALGPLTVTGTNNLILACYGTHASIAVTGYTLLSSPFLKTLHKEGLSSGTTVTPTTTPTDVWAGIAISIKNL